MVPSPVLKLPQEIVNVVNNFYMSIILARKFTDVNGIFANKNKALRLFR